jgi:DNA-binding GntR family transcriptional regulator
MPNEGVLADRIAAALVHHEPGWRLPRLTALARRYRVSVPEVEAAVGELAARHLLRRLPDGRVYRASPAECQVPLAGLTGLVSYVDPMGGELTCPGRQVSCRRVPEDAARALRLPPGETVLVVRCRWLIGGEPGGLAVTYLPRRLTGLTGCAGTSLLDGLPCAAWQAAPVQAAMPGLPRAAQVELGPPPPSVAKMLRLGAGQPVASVTTLFEDAAGTPAALMVAMLRPDLFRIVVQAPEGGQPASPADGSGSSWTGAAGDWEP